MTVGSNGKRPGRVWLYLPFAIGAIIVFSYFLLWRSGADRIKQEIAAWATAQNAAGLSVRYDSLSAEGFPFFLRVHVSLPSITDQRGRRWAGERLSIDALPYQLDRLIFSATGAQEVSAPEIGDWTISADMLRASIKRDQERGWVFATSFSEIAAESLTGDIASLGELIFDLGPASRAEHTLILSLRAARADAPASDGDRISLEALNTVLIAVESDALLHGAEAWRQAGGQLVVNGLQARIDEADITLQGELAIDEAHHLVGRLQTEISNPAAFALVLGKIGALTSHEARAASTGLSLLSLGNNGKIGAPISFRNGRAEIAGIKIAETPKVD